MDYTVEGTAKTRPSGIIDVKMVLIPTVIENRTLLDNDGQILVDDNLEVLLEGTL